MGVAVSGWKLARAVSEAGELGVVSSTGLDAVLVRKLQLGDPDGGLREAFAHFPVPEVAQRIWTRYYIDGGKAPERPFLAKPIFTHPLSKSTTELVVLANFAEVWLAKRGHKGLVGINLLEKIQIATLPSLFGAMLAGVDFVLMGAGIPREIPAILDLFARGEEAHLTLNVAQSPSDPPVQARFDPKLFMGADVPLPRPKFLAIVSSSVLAVTLARKSAVPPDGFVLEAPTAGGHNAPPRGAPVRDEIGQPVYGTRDVPDLADMRALDLPFWLAGSYGKQSMLQQARQVGAQGIQVGTAFAFCDESGIDQAIKARLIRSATEGAAAIFTDPDASPTGFPFKVASLQGTLSDPAVYGGRERVCDLGYLRQMYRKEDGSIGYRCSGEPAEDYVRKGGAEEDTIGKKCLCNGLLATVGLPQRRKDGYVEPALITAGDELHSLAAFLKPGKESYSAADVLECLRTPAT